MEVKKFTLLFMIALFTTACTPHGTQENIYNGSAFTCTQIKGAIYGDRHRHLNNSHASAITRAQLTQDYYRYGCKQVDDESFNAW